MFAPLDYLGLVPGSLGRFVSAPYTYTFQSSIPTAVSCAVRVGDGYSTNSRCQNSGCGGDKCTKPSTCLIGPSDQNLYSTKEATIQYTIGSNSDNLCSGINLSDNQEIVFNIDGQDDVPRKLTNCTTTEPKKCTVSLVPTGKELALKIGTTPLGVAQYQTIHDIVPRDTTPPLALIDA